MELFDWFKKKKVELTEEQRKWNKMWELWGQEQVDSPYAELMTYQSEINNGGHNQYFANIENIGSLQKEISVLETVLSSKLKNNLQKAYEAYLTLKENKDDEKAEEIIENCDNIFFDTEEEIHSILEEYSNKIEFEEVLMKMEKNDKKHANYMALGMCFGMLAGGIAMSILSMFGQIAWGGLAVGIGLMIGMVVGLVISKKK